MSRFYSQRSYSEILRTPFSVLSGWYATVTDGRARDAGTPSPDHRKRCLQCLNMRTRLVVNSHQGQRLHSSGEDQKNYCEHRPHSVFFSGTKKKHKKDKEREKMDILDVFFFIFFIYSLLIYFLFFGYNVIIKETNGPMIIKNNTYTRW